MVVYPPPQHLSGFPGDAPDCANHVDPPGSAVDGLVVGVCAAVAVAVVPEQAQTADSQAAGS